MNDWSTLRAVPAPTVRVREVGGDCILLDSRDLQIFGLNLVGARMWAVLSESPSIRAAYERLLREYDVEPETLAADLQGLLDRLIERGLIALV